jgi:hypothetical protein
MAVTGAVATLCTMAVTGAVATLCTMAVTGAVHVMYDAEPLSLRLSAVVLCSQKTLA